MPLAELGRFGLRYFLYYCGLQVLLVAIALVLVDIGHWTSSVVLPLTAAIATLDYFVKTRLAMPTPREYWLLVGIGFVVSSAVEVVTTAAALRTGAMEQEISVGGFILISLFLAVLTLLPNMLGFSKLFSKRSLEHAFRKRSQTS